MRNHVNDSFGIHLHHRGSLHDTIISMCLEDLLMRKLPTDNVTQSHTLCHFGNNSPVQCTNILNQIDLQQKSYSNPDIQPAIIAQQKVGTVISEARKAHHYKISPHRNAVKLGARNYLSSEEVKITEHDVLLGRGSGVTKHEGNKKYRNLIVRSQYNYVLATRSEKTAMARRIVAEIRRNKGRFLKQDESGAWIDVGNKKAVEKTSQALREGFAHKLRQNLLEKGFDL